MWEPFWNTFNRARIYNIERKREIILKGGVMWVWILSLFVTSAPEPIHLENVLIGILIMGQLFRVIIMGHNIISADSETIAGLI